MRVSSFLVGFLFVFMNFLCVNLDDVNLNISIYKKRKKFDLFVVNLGICSLWW